MGRGIAYRRTMAHRARVKNRNNYKNLNGERRLFNPLRMSTPNGMDINTKEKLNHAKCDCDFCRPQARTVEFIRIENKHRKDLNNGGTNNA